MYSKDEPQTRSFWARKGTYMQYSDFKGKKISRLGFGMMRLPKNADGTIDEGMTRDMIDYAMEHGVNYFDTAYPYHEGKSEIVTGKLLSRYPRERWFLADKYPGHQISDESDPNGQYQPERLFNRQLEKCCVEYFDFYLLHNVYEKSLGYYRDPNWGIMEYLIRMKQEGKIKHLGFSCHGRMPNIREFLDEFGEEMEFCQIQFNYLDYTLQKAGEKYDFLTGRNLPVWVMEPVRGGKLAGFDQINEEKLKRARPDESIASWAFRWLAGFDNVKLILSGMSSFEQMKDNIRTFENEKPLTDREVRLLYEIADDIKRAVPCTGCGYCLPACPMELNIPELIAAYNDLKFASTVNVPMHVESMPPEKRPSACIGCGHCMQICPQQIGVPAIMHEFVDALEKAPNWDEICRQRDRYDSQ